MIDLQQIFAGYFRLACERDLEGIVAKLKHGAYGERWYKIRNSRYSQYEGRRELFEKRMAGRALEPTRDPRLADEVLARELGLDIAV